jgi:hypothetical protein
VIVCFVNTEVIKQVPERPEARVVSEGHLCNHRVFRIYSGIQLYES